MIKLNLGSGKRNQEGYTNIDAVKRTEETVVGNILELTYEDASIDEIFSEHMIEHLTKNEFDHFFSECSRMLKSGGKLALYAPCIVSAINSYNKGDWPIAQLEEFLYAEHLHEYDYHRHGIYEEKLRRMCTKYNFAVDSIEHRDTTWSLNEIVLLATKL